MNYFLARLTSIALLVLPGFLAAEYQPLDKIVAIVDDNVILQSEFTSRMNNIRAQYSSQPGVLPPDDILKKQVLERMVLEKIQLQLADRMGIRVDDDTLNREIENIARQNGMSLADFRKDIENSGASYSSVREEIRNEIRISRVRERQVAGRVRITDQEVERFLSSETGQKSMSSAYHLKNILIAIGSEDTPGQIKEKEQKANDIYRELVAGGDFHQLALKHSDANNALEGGDLGWRTAAQLPSLFASAATKLKKGQVSRPIQAANGFHILKLVQRKGEESHVVTQSKTRHILIQPTAILTSDQARLKLLDIREQILNGADFAELAIKHSDDPGSGSRGGDLGWVSPGEMVPIFDQMMQNIPVGQVSPLIETQFGWHILEVQGRREQDVSDQMQVIRAKNALHKRKFEEELELWLRKIREEAFVEFKV